MWREYAEMIIDVFLWTDPNLRMQKGVEKIIKKFRAFWVIGPDHLTELQKTKINQTYTQKIRFKKTSEIQRSLHSKKKQDTQKSDFVSAKQEMNETLDCQWETLVLKERSCEITDMNWKKCYCQKIVTSTNKQKFCEKLTTINTDDRNENPLYRQDRYDRRHGIQQGRRNWTKTMN